MVDVGEHAQGYRSRSMRRIAEANDDQARIAAFNWCFQLVLSTTRETS